MFLEDIVSKNNEIIEDVFKDLPEFRGFLNDYEMLDSFEFGDIMSYGFKDELCPSYFPFKYLFSENCWSLINDITMVKPHDVYPAALTRLFNNVAQNTYISKNPLYRGNTGTSGLKQITHFVIDIDNHNSEDLRLIAMQAKKFINAFVTKYYDLFKLTCFIDFSGRGLHIWFKHKPIKIADKKKKDIDITIEEYKSMVTFVCDKINELLVDLVKKDSSMKTFKVDYTSSLNLAGWIRLPGSIHKDILCMGKFLYIKDFKEYEFFYGFKSFTKDICASFGVSFSELFSYKLNKKIEERFKKAISKHKSLSLIEDIEREAKNLTLSSGLDYSIHKSRVKKLETCASLVEKGFRNNFLFIYANELKCLGFSEADAFKKCLDLNKIIPNPLPEKEVSNCIVKKAIHKFNDSSSYTFKNEDINLRIGMKALEPFDGKLRFRFNPNLSPKEKNKARDNKRKLIKELKIKKAGEIFAATSSYKEVELALGICFATAKKYVKLAKIGLNNDKKILKASIKNKVRYINASKNKFVIKTAFKNIGKFFKPFKKVFVEKPVVLRI